MRYFFIISLFFLTACQEPASVKSLMNTQSAFKECVAKESQSTYCMSIANKVELIKQKVEELRLSPLAFGQSVLELQTKISQLKSESSSSKELAPLEEQLTIYIALIALFESPQ